MTLHKDISTPVDATQAETRDLLDELLAQTKGSSQAISSASILVGECLEPEHPTLTGRAKISWEGERGGRDERWLAMVQGLVLRRGDRVLIQRPANFDDPLVTGVVDGLRQRERYEAPDSPSLRLKGDQSLTITGESGAPLFSVYEGSSGPVIRLLTKDLEIEVEGRLRMNAEEIELVARRGSVGLKASDDVILQGEMVKLN
jgi:hypothetical protein